MDKYQKRWTEVKQWLRPRGNWVVAIDHDSTFALEFFESVPNYLSATLTCSLLPTRTEVKIVHRSYQKGNIETFDLGVGYRKDVTTTETGLAFTLPIFTKGQSVWESWSIASVRSLLLNPIPSPSFGYPTLIKYVKKGEAFRQRYIENAERWKNKGG